jgi:hypothetical protein
MQVVVASVSKVVFLEWLPITAAVAVVAVMALGQLVVREVKVVVVAGQMTPLQMLPLARQTLVAVGAALILTVGRMVNQVDQASSSSDTGISNHGPFRKTHI